LSVLNEHRVWTDLGRSLGIRPRTTDHTICPNRVFEEFIQRMMSATPEYINMEKIEGREKRILTPPIRVLKILERS
jgi:hypothetical protein